MKAVLISVHPEWCKLIADGKKTIEVRKSKPKLATPFKVYVYCTKPTHRFSVGCGNYYFDDQLFKESGKIIYGCDFGGIFEPTVYYNGKVIGEFVCDFITNLSIKYSNPDCKAAHKIFPFTGLTDKQIMDYLGNGKDGYGWHISDLVIYDEPKELNEFSKECPSNNCWECPYSISSDPRYFYEETKIVGCRNNVKRPPQSWCYVEKMRADYEGLNSPEVEK